jgi:uncharacterized protein YyaL (SSP411 family)
MMDSLPSGEAALAEARQANRLIDSTSPYLLQHVFNPVDWYPWGDEAFALARREDKPIFLSIGYSSCHWCHVMAHESFEDPAVAALLNANFVSIKVDREERPDVDDVYMAATVAMNEGQGGWPMSVFLTPELQPFFTGTYFPPLDRWGRPGFSTLLRRIAELWRTERENLVQQAAEVTQHLLTQHSASPRTGLGAAELERALAQLEGGYDARYGGFGVAPKFPPATTIALLLRLSRRLDSAHALEMARTTLEGMARGGIRDHIGGGFHRYATDERWLVPHFEKMLYDNALLAKAYIEGFQASGEPLLACAAAETLDFVLRDMLAPEGGFYSALDADSEGVEGRYYVWTPAEIATVLGDEDARLFCALFDISEAGNWEGKSIPNRLDPERVVAWRVGEKAEKIAQVVEAGRPRVLEARKRRIAPGLDDKVLTAWNGLMISALAEGYRLLREQRYLDAASRGADFVLRSPRSKDGGLLRTWRAGRATVGGFLEDYAFAAEGLIELYEAGGAQRYLHEALDLAERMLAEFRGEDGAFSSTANAGDRLPVRPRDSHDGALPAANATAAHVLARLSYHFERADFREAARRAIEAHGETIARQPGAFAKSLIVLNYLMDGPVELALVGTPGSEDYEALASEIGQCFLPHRVTQHSDPSAGKRPAPAILAGKMPVNDRAALYVCRAGTCLPPITEPTAVRAALLQSSRR